MMEGKKCVAMLLAGGQGSRLGRLTKNLAKPAVPFGGKFRIIDFALSNCTHSGIDTIGVLTQYQPHLLNAYVGNGRAWDLDRTFGGVSVLPPYKGSQGGDWYKGTANAIYQNIHFIREYHSEYVLVLSGDHIYKMDYSHLIEYHIEKGAKATIGVIQVPWHETNRYGIINVDSENKVVEFEEKPDDPKSNLASMGIYVFDRKLLEDYLIEDEKNPHSTHDFGKDVIPKILDEQDLLYAYLFDGYWKDVGTVQSLWEAHMDLLEDEPSLDLFDPHWKIYTVNANNPPQYISPNAEIQRSLVNEGCTLFGKVKHSVLSYGVRVGEGSVIHDSVIMPNVTIGKNVRINRAIIESGTVIQDGETIGSSDESTSITLIGGNQGVLSETIPG